MEIYNLEDIFVTEGVPKFTFVKPPNYADILLDIRKSGKPVIIEGQSGSGKTTTIKRIIEELNLNTASYLTSRQPADVEALKKIVTDQSPGCYVIDDFHRLEPELKEGLANIAKLAAEQGDLSNLPKLVIIGINQVGTDLIQLVPDIAKRTGIHRIKPGKDTDVIALVNSGCNKLNIEIENSIDIFRETRGDYWLTQQFCQSACSMANLTSTSNEKIIVPLNIDNVRNRVISKLESAYYPAVKVFCRGRRFRPSNDPYFKLLKTIGNQDSSVVDLNELANASTDARGSINNIKDRRLSILLESKPDCKKYFYYNNETKNFAIDDPALFYFIKHLNWEQLRQDCGFRESSIDRDWAMAISFAGENRDLAKKIVDDLESLDVSVFYDEYYENNYLGKAWGPQFLEIFTKKCDFVIVILDKYHHQKIWPTFERDCFTPRVQLGEVIPILLDDTKFVGISCDINSIRFDWQPTEHNWEKRVTDEIVMRLIDRIDR